MKLCKYTIIAATPGDFPDKEDIEDALQGCEDIDNTISFSVEKAEYTEVNTDFYLWNEAPPSSPSTGE